MKKQKTTKKKATKTTALKQQKSLYEKTQETIDNLQRKVDETLLSESARNAIDHASDFIENTKEKLNDAQKTVTSVKEKAKQKLNPASCNLIIEYGNSKYNADTVLATALAKCKADFPDIEIRTFEVYLTVEQDCAYYVVNGVGKPEFKVQL